MGDVRNTLAVSLAQELEAFGVTVSVYDPLVEGERLTAIGLEAIGDPFAEAQPRYDIVILCFLHQQFVAKPLSDYIGLLDAGTGVEVWVDLKGIFANAVRGEPGIVCGTL